MDASHAKKIIPEDFYEAAMRASTDLPFLSGRDRKAISLGIPYEEGKRLVKHLQAMGMVKIEGRRLCLTAIFPNQ